jgi:hypothetical protein
VSNADESIGIDIVAVLMHSKAQDSAMSMSLIDRLTKENERLLAERDHYEEIARAYEVADNHIRYARRLQAEGVHYPPKGAL